MEEHTSGLVERTSGGQTADRPAGKDGPIDDAYRCSARGETRTRKGSLPADFESAAYTIPPLGRAQNLIAGGGAGNPGTERPIRLHLPQPSAREPTAPADPVISPRPFHPWHDIPPGPNPPETVTAIIEIPAHGRNKYELDKELGVFRLDRVLHSAVHYPGDYGFIPRTLGDDGDPLDVIVLLTEPVFTGCLIEVRPVGVFEMVDRGEADEKIIAVATSDPFAESIHDLGDIRPHALREIEHFFQVYKNLEGTRVESRGFQNAAAAKQFIRRYITAYDERFGAPGA